MGHTLTRQIHIIYHDTSLFFSYVICFHSKYEFPLQLNIYNAKNNKELFAGDFTSPALYEQA